MKRMHIGIAREYLIRHIRLHGPGCLTLNGRGTSSAEEAIRAIEDDGREVFSSCPTPLSDGRCPGHERATRQRKAGGAEAPAGRPSRTERVDDEQQ